MMTAPMEAALPWCRCGHMRPSVVATSETAPVRGQTSAPGVGPRWRSGCGCLLLSRSEEAAKGPCAGAAPQCPAPNYAALSCHIQVTGPQVTQPQCSTRPAWRVAPAAPQPTLPHTAKRPPADAHQRSARERRKRWPRLHLCLQLLKWRYSGVCVSIGMTITVASLVPD